MPKLDRIAFRLASELVKSPRVLRGPAFDSWEACQAACSAHGSSWVTGNLARVRARHAGRTPMKGPFSDLGALLGLAFVGRAQAAGNKLRVLDFGGGTGEHYWEACALFGADRFDWVVVETESTVSECRAAGITTPRFATTPAGAKALLGDVDLCLMSGTLHYCPDGAGITADLRAVHAATYVVRRSPILTALQSHLALKWWMQSSFVFHHVREPAVEKEMFNRCLYPLTHLTEASLTPFDEGRVRVLDRDDGAFSHPPGETVGSRTIVWQ